jgi:hypothetical protein
VSRCCRGASGNPSDVRSRAREAVAIPNVGNEYGYLNHVRKLTDAVSHTHPDHIGNVDEFPKAMLLVHKAEYEWPDANGKPRFNPTHPVTKLEGDYDVFGLGSVGISQNRTSSATIY